MDDLEIAFDEMIDKKYEQDFLLNSEKIINYLKENKDNVVINQKKFGIINKYEILSDRDMQKELSGVKVTDCIETLKCDEKFISILNEYISRDVSHLTLPLEVIMNIDLFSFPNLMELEIQGHATPVTKELLARIPNVKRVIGNFRVDEEILKDSIATKDFSPCFCYDGKIFENKSSYLNSLMNIYSKNPYQEIGQIFDFIDNLGVENLDKLRVYNHLGSNFISDEHIKYEKNVKGSFDYETSKKCEDDCYTLSLGYIKDVKDVLNVIHLFESRGKHIDRVILNLENKTYDDIYLLKELNKYDFIIKYEGDSHSINLSDFIAMRDTLDYYKGLIEQSNLSQFEKIIFAYDIIKSFEYQEVDDGHEKFESREISSIVREGKIVCVGYSVFLAQLLKEIGIESYSFGTSVPVHGQFFGHRRNLVKVDDEKYNIHGVYALDSTWDDAKNIIECIDKDGNKVYRQGQENVLSDDVIVRYHDNLCSYRYFMVPGDKYQQVFEGEELPNLKLSTKYDEKVTERLSIKVNNELLQNVENDRCEFMKSKDINPEKFLEAVKNVRFMEGYTLDTIDDSLASIIDINKMDEITVDSLSIKR